MGTRADFYVGIGPKAEYLGSVTWDGYEWEENKKCPLLIANSLEEYKAAVAGIAKERDDWTDAKEGWPWPWDDSKTTDRTYAFDNGKTLVFHWGKTPLPDDELGAVPDGGWPNMRVKRMAHDEVMACSGLSPCDVCKLYAMLPSEAKPYIEKLWLELDDKQTSRFCWYMRGWRQAIEAAQKAVDAHKPCDSCDRLDGGCTVDMVSYAIRHLEPKEVRLHV